MKKYKIFLCAAVAFSASAAEIPADEPQYPGDFAPTWESLAAWECPEWFKDAKFGIWAHWGPQCEAEDGDWYARFMYYPGSGQYNWHVFHFGNPSSFGLKDLCNHWKAENWNPKELIDLYKSTGARYFMTLANHHDNFDLWDSPYQQWNSASIGPKRDIVGEWAAACREAGLPLGVSVHASHAWTWLEPSQAFDGKLTLEDGYTPNPDGTEKWWKGLDPQELYAQNHAHSSGWENSGTIHSQWDWGNGASIPDEAFRRKLMNRTLQLVYDYNPDMIYFDDTALPFWGCDEQWGLDFLSSFYNHSAAANNGSPQVVATGKQLQPHIKDAMMWDVERGIPDRMQPDYWQTCTCIGDWHYNQATYNNNGYKNAATVIRMLVDVISKNGNLLLSVPVKGDGTIDDKERAILADIKAWMDINSESVYGTRVWKTFGEGPLAEADNPMNAQGFNEGLNYSSRDVRFVQKDGTIYATIMAWPQAGDYVMTSFSPLATTYSGNVTSVKLLGHGPVNFSQNADGLHITIPITRPNEIAPVFEIITDGATITAAERFLALADNIKDFLASVAPITSRANSGQYNINAYEAMCAVLDDVTVRSADASDEQLTRLFDELNTAYKDFLKNGTNPGGLNSNMTDCKDDMTVEKLVERNHFTRSAGGSQRFGAPANWTVENFSIPNGGDGIKQGLDKYSGTEALMLGVWNDRSANTDGDLANARIYRRITLPRGYYFFGATYNTTYNISDQAYMFASSHLSNTSDIPSEAIAFHPVAKCGESQSDFYGIWFMLEDEQEIVLGWQADLAQGSDTQEFRATEVALLRIDSCDRASIEELLANIETYLAALKEKDRFGTASGQFPLEAFHEMESAAQLAGKELATITDSELSSFYFDLRDRWQSFLGARNAGASEDLTFGTDITLSELLESTAFSPAKPEVTTRFNSPLNWTVENYSITSGADGVKQGLDKFGGTYALMLGVWNDRYRNTGGDIADARIYRKVNLDEGDYYFGATYNTLYQLACTYMFMNSEVLPTAEIESEAMAWCDINDARSDGHFHGIYFSVGTPGEYFLGWQADLRNGPSCQEFRADNVLLMKKNESGIYDIIDNAHTSGIDFTKPYDVYDLRGIIVSNPIPGNLYILRQGGRAIKSVLNY